MLVDQPVVGRLINEMHVPSPSRSHVPTRIPEQVITEERQVVDTKAPSETEVTQPEPWGIFVVVGLEKRNTKARVHRTLAASPGIVTASSITYPYSLSFIFPFTNTRHPPLAGIESCHGSMQPPKYFCLRLHRAPLHASPPERGENLSVAARGRWLPRSHRRLLVAIYCVLSPSTQAHAANRQPSRSPAQEGMIYLLR